MRASSAISDSATYERLMNREETIRQARLQLVLREGSREVALTEQVHEYRNRPCIPPALLLLAETA